MNLPMLEWASTNRFSLALILWVGLAGPAQAEFVDDSETFAGRNKDLTAWEEYDGDHIQQDDGLTLRQGAEYTTRARTIGIGESVRVTEKVLAADSDLTVLLTTNSAGTVDAFHGDTQFLGLTYSWSSREGKSQFSAYAGGSAEAKGRPIGSASEPSGTVHQLEISRPAIDSAVFAVLDQEGNVLHVDELSLEGFPTELFISLSAGNGLIHRVEVRRYTARKISSAPDRVFVESFWSWRSGGDWQDIAAAVESIDFLGMATRAIDEKILQEPSAENFCRRASIWETLGDQDEALADYFEAVRLEPTCRLAYSRQGSIYLSRGEYETAIANFNAVLTLDPKQSSVYGYRGKAWLEQGKVDKASADFNKALRLDQELDWVYAMRGQVWQSRGEPEKALADYNRAIDLDPTIAAYHGSRGLLWASREENEKALADLNEAIRLDHELVLAYNGRGIMQREMGDFDRAIADFTEAIRLDPKCAPAYYNRGYAWDSQGSIDQAIVDYGKAVQLNPSSIAGQNNLAWLLATSLDAKYRDGKRALAAATIACELTQWKNDDCINTLSAAYAAAGKFDKAKEVLQQVSEINPAADRTILQAMEKAFDAEQPYLVQPGHD